MKNINPIYTEGPYLLKNLLEILNNHKIFYESTRHESTSVEKYYIKVKNEYNEVLAYLEVRKIMDYEVVYNNPWVDKKGRMRRAFEIIIDEFPQIREDIISLELFNPFI